MIGKKTFEQTSGSGVYAAAVHGVHVLMVFTCSRERLTWSSRKKVLHGVHIQEDETPDLIWTCAWNFVTEFETAAFLECVSFKNDQKDDHNVE